MNVSLTEAWQHRALFRCGSATCDGGHVCIMPHDHEGHCHSFDGACGSLPKLLTCPFCGSEAELECVSGIRWHAICGGCRAWGPSEASETAATQAWNRRETT